MKTEQLTTKKEMSLRIEELCRGRFALFAVLFCLIFALSRMDGVLMKTMRASYSHDFGLIDEYAREEPTRTPPTIGSEIRLTTMSGV
jgi:hypothetical protein